MTEASVFLERSLTLRSFNSEHPVVVSFCKPVEEAGTWSCEYTIDWPNEPSRSKAFGVDAIQSLLLAFEKVSAELYTSPQHISGAIYWLEPGGGFGLPASRQLRDMLEGIDIVDQK